MPQLLTLSRAARLVGVTRGALQKKIQRGELPTFEGMVRASDLEHAYPDARLEDNTALERMAQIQENALFKLAERALPDAQVLVARLTKLSGELAEAQAQLAYYRSLMERLDQRLDQLAQDGDGALPAAAASLNAWLRNEVEAAARSIDYPTPLITKDSFLRIMAAQVRILPSGREFFVEGNDTLLEAALRSGLALEYGCSNGACGKCKARVVSGEVKKVRHHDYVLTESDKSMDYMLMCSNTPITDAVIEASEAGGAQDIPLQELIARVSRIEHPAEAMTLLHLQTPRSKRLRFLAGQFVTLTLPQGTAASLPIASCPCDDRNLQFHVRHTPGDAFSDYVLGRLRVSDSVGVEGPRGSFVMDESSTRSLIFIACDTGFAPIKSLIEHAMALNIAESMHLYWATAEQSGHYAQNLCRSWADALDNFRYTALTAERSDGAEALADAVLQSVFDDHPDLPDLDVYAAGAERELQAIRQGLMARGMPGSQLHTQIMG
jgi:CDP-4-dehydro-6-deoxyglucose reductase